VLAEIANECFMPLGYGGGVRSLESAGAVLEIGFEKVAVNSFAAEDPAFITKLAEYFGSQAVIASIDAKKDILGRYRVCVQAGRKDTGRDPVEWARELEDRGAGELLLTSINREGTWQGFDLELVKAVSDAVGIPVIAHGGAGNIEHIRDVVRKAGASAVALGSMVVFQKKGMGVLINFQDLKNIGAKIS
jgi:cyclase